MILKECSYIHCTFKYSTISLLRTGLRMYPRYFKLEFAFHRANYQSQPRPINPAKVELQAQVIELRSSGWSFPVIARHLGISVGTVWNLVKRES